MWIFLGRRYRFKSNLFANIIYLYYRLDLKVGTIQDVKLHPNADSLYIETVDVGENRPRTVISSLVNVIPIEELQGIKAIFLCNLKPQKMRGISSEAMILCAETPDKLKCEIIEPPKNAKPGDSVIVEGYDGGGSGNSSIIKTKIFQSIAKDLQINDKGEATYQSANWLVNGQKCTTKSLINTPIS